MLAHAKKAGIDTAAVLSRLGLSEAELKAETNPSELWQAYDRLGRELRMALAAAKGLSPFDETDREIFIHYLVGADDLGGLLERFIKFTASHRERMGFDYQLEFLPTAAVLSGYHCAAVADETTTLSYLRGINKLLYLLCWLTSSRIKPARVGVPGANFDDAVHQLWAMDCPVTYHATNYEVWFPANQLERPVVRDLADVKLFLSCIGSVVAGPAAQQSLADIASEMVERHCQATGQMLTFQQLALVLNTSETTLRRRLHRQGEGDGFSTIRQGCQLRLAKRFLAGAELTVDDIALRIGFQDCNAFRRSFKRWTGMTPSAYRETAARGDSEHHDTRAAATQ